ncbi:hypothetical protein [Streptomyces flaveolus]|uniref:hypothetical protein n=1 Tax=Streptomyces flaveolus TaxID=67297 RepID=UPI003809867A
MLALRRTALALAVGAAASLLAAGQALATAGKANYTDLLGGSQQVTDPERGI